MSKEIITKIKRERGFTYSVNKEGEVIKESYNWFKDPYTLVVVAIVILGCLYYYQVNSMKTIEKNFESSCMNYISLREQWMIEHPGQIPTLQEVFSVKVNTFSGYNPKMR